MEIWERARPTGRLTGGRLEHCLGHEPPGSWLHPLPIASTTPRGPWTTSPDLARFLPDRALTIAWPRRPDQGPDQRRRVDGPVFGQGSSGRSTGFVLCGGGHMSALL